MIKNKHVFSQVIYHTEPAVTTPGDHEYLSADLWQPQEDITIIGVLLRISIEQINANDGMLLFQGQVSQSGDFDKPGQIISLSGAWHWNTAPAFGYHNQKELVVMFPDGAGMPVHEGGNVYLHMSDRVTYSSGDTIWAAKAEIFYVKGCVGS